MGNLPEVVNLNRIYLKLSMFGKFLVHDWSRRGGLKERKKTILQQFIGGQTSDQNLQLYQTITQFGWKICGEGGLSHTPSLYLHATCRKWMRPSIVSINQARLFLPQTLNKHMETSNQ